MSPAATSGVLQRGYRRVETLFNISKGTWRLFSVVSLLRRRPCRTSDRIIEKLVL